MAESKQVEHGYGYAGDKNERISERALPKEPDMSGASLAAAWKKVSSDGSPEDWVVFHFEDPAASAELSVYATGAKGLAELRACLTAQDAGGKVLFGALRVAACSAGLRRPKFVYFSFVGASVHELQRAQANPLKRKVQAFFGSVQLTEELSGNEIESWTAAALGWRLLQSESSHKSESFDLGGGDVVKCADLHADGDSDGDDDEYDSD
jgi:Cofilin/tropomyosin-type actin-binding protein